jgi:hypothetical protein
MDAEQNRFVELVLRNPVNRVVLERGAQLGVPDWWLTAGRGVPDGMERYR